MRTPQQKRPGRRGFTLIEMIVVIAIIAVLMALLTGAVMKAFIMAARTKTRTDLTNLGNAVVSFKTRYKGIGYFPSRIRLAEVGIAAGGYNINANKLDSESVAFLRQMFPHIDFSKPIDWNGDGTAGNSDVTLEGDQCLVFFVGGIPKSGTPGCTGFSINLSDPSYHTTHPVSPGDTSVPLYSFDSSRLVLLHGNAYYSYVDGFGKDSLGNVHPYVYFSNYNKTNGYNHYFTTLANSDCNSLPGVTLWPYAGSLRAAGSTFPDCVYQNPDSFQIISAGEDGQFGPGTNPTAPAPFFWTPTNADSYPSNSPAGADDMSNFHDKVLGASS